MKKMRKIAALFLAALVLAALLAGCSSKQCVWCGKSFRGAGHDTGAGYVCDDCYNSLSGVSSTASVRSSNTGVWIAVVVMVFIAVFSATSGVVYLVLQKKLPPEKPVSRSRRIPQEPADYDDFESPWPSAPRPVSNTAPRPSGGVWICPRDRSRNSGPYCTVCGANRPAVPRQGNSASQRGPGQARPQNSASWPQSAPAAQQGARPRAAFEADSFGSMNQRPVQRPAAPAFRASQPAQRPAPNQAVEQEKEYRPRFARQEPVEEPEVDSELLAAIFREAAKDPEE
ncbi:MAG: hypothetical protein ACI3XG_04245 [Faecousia sp.]